MSYRTETLADCLAAIASTRVAPAGGTAAAICGAFGTALYEMACTHASATASGDEAAIDTTAEMLEHQRETLLELADRDAAVVAELFSAASDTASETVRKRAFGVPLTIAKACLNVLERGLDVTAIATTNAIADVWTGTHLVYASLQASLYTVRTNLAAMSDRHSTEKISRRCDRIEDRATQAFEQIQQSLERRQ